MLPNNQLVKEEIKMEIRKYLETNKSGNIRCHKLWDVAKTVLQGKFLPVNTYIKKKGSQINNLTLHFKELEKEQTKPEVSRSI